MNILILTVFIHYITYNFKFWNTRIWSCSNRSFYIWKKRIIRYVYLVFNDQDKQFFNYKLTTLNSITVDRSPLIDEEVSNKEYIDDELDKRSILRFNQTL